MPDALLCWHRTTPKYSTISLEAPVESPRRRAAAPRLLCLLGAGVLLVLIPLVCTLPVFFFAHQPSRSRGVDAGPVSVRAYNPRHQTQRHDLQAQHSSPRPQQQRAAVRWPLPSSLGTGTANGQVSVWGTAAESHASGLGLGLMLLWMAAVVVAVLRLQQPSRWGVAAVAGDAEVPREDAGPTSDAAEPQAESAGVCDVMRRVVRSSYIPRPYLSRWKMYMLEIIKSGESVSKVADIGPGTSDLEGTSLWGGGNRTWLDQMRQAHILSMGTSQC